MSAKIVDNLRHSLIIGRQTIGRYNLLPKLTNLIEVCTVSIPVKSIDAVCRVDDITNVNNHLQENCNNSWVCHEDAINNTVKIPSRENFVSVGAVYGGVCTSPSQDCLLCSFSERSSDLFGSSKEDDLVEEPDSSLLDDLLDRSENISISRNIDDLSENSNQKEEILSLIQLIGTDAMVERLRTLCRQYVDVFALEVKATPARVPPMEFTVDAEKLKKGRGKLTPRPQHPTKTDALKVMITELLRLGVIRVSHQDTASQVLLVAKKGTDKLRFCIDYRALNEASSMEGWPIPHIKTLIESLGAQHATYFGIMDLTSGYHQAPLAELNKSYTAFITSFGLFEWNRVPMGLKGAPSYFQRIMMVNVLGDLLHKLVEVYLDDMIVFGRTEEEFLINVELVFKRLREVNVTCNPKKCRFGLKEIDYVGHTLSKDGWTFSRSQIDRVLDWQMPTNKGELMKFLGLCKYFTTHVQDMTSVTQPLSAMIHDGLDPYTKRHRNVMLKWTDKTREAFKNVKIAIDQLPLLYFIDVSQPIYLETDASDYGIGGVLYQMINGEKKIIEFFSKSLSGSLRNWSTPDKEAYAIYYAFAKYDYLLYSSKFILRTDHKNLTYINFEGSKKVLRWKMLLQQYDFEIEYIEGEKNVVADCMSRLCPDSDDSNESITEVTSTVKADEGIAMLDTICEIITLFDEDNELLVLDEDEISIPQDKYAHIESVHNALVGHNGVNRTMHKLNRKGIRFPKMRMWVKQFIQMCPFCQKMEYKRLKAKVVPFTLATYGAMLKLSIDSIGPLPEDSRGNKYVLVVIDTFTRWTMCYPLQTLNAVDCIRALIQHIGIFGAPSELISDNGSQFDNTLVEEIVSMLRDKYKVTKRQSFSLAYSHEEQGIVERVNRGVLEGMKAIVYEENSTYYWSDYLPFIQRILNTEVHSSTLWAPSHLVFGTALDLDRGILTPNIKLREHNHKDYSTYVEHLVTAQKHAIDAAIYIQKEKDKLHMSQSFDTSSNSIIAHITEFEIGSYVLLEYVDTGLSKKPPNKLMTHLGGPYQVMSYKGAHYNIRHLNHNTEQTVHVSRLSLFRYDKERVDPKWVLAKDNCEWFVERALRHYFVDDENNETQDRRYHHS